MHYNRAARTLLRGLNTAVQRIHTTERRVGSGWRQLRVMAASTTALSHSHNHSRPYLLLLLLVLTVTKMIPTDTEKDVRADDDDGR